MMYDENTTVDDVLREWDAGNPVWSVEMGGLGPGYEQCIQMMAMEILRDKKDIPFPEKEEWDKWGNEAIQRLEDEGNYGFSGAQAGAAKNIAVVFLKQGYKKGLDMVDKERHIQISKFLGRKKA
jgi:hypothetical protein